MTPTGYLLAYEKIRLDIELGRYLPGSALPPENELAQACGVSRTTLRKALARLIEENRLVSRPGVGNFVRMPMEQEPAVAELNIGIEVYNALNFSPFLVKTLDECQRAGRKQKANLILKSTRELQQGEGIDGAIFPLVSDQDYGKIAELSKRMPVMMFNRISDHPDLSYVAVDYADTVFRIISRMLRNGARRIAFIGGSHDPVYYAAYNREIGFRRAFAANGVELEEEMVVPGDKFWDFDYLRNFFIHRQPEIAFVMSEGNLPNVFAVLETVRAKLTDPVYLICFDDIQSYDPRGRFHLSGVSMPFGRMADRAMEYLANAVRSGKREPLREIFTPYVMINDCPFLI